MSVAGWGRSARGPRTRLFVNFSIRHGDGTPALIGNAWQWTRKFRCAAAVSYPIIFANHSVVVAAVNLTRANNPTWYIFHINFSLEIVHGAGYSLTANMSNTFILLRIVWPWDHQYIVREGAVVTSSKSYFVLVFPKSMPETESMGPIAWTLIAYLYKSGIIQVVYDKTNNRFYRQSVPIKGYRIKVSGAKFIRREKLKCSHEWNK